MAICMALGATTNPRPPSPFTTAVLGVSCTILTLGVGLILPVSHNRTYPTSLAMPCESTPLRSADNKTVVAKSASDSGQPIFIKISFVKEESVWYEYIVLYLLHKNSKKTVIRYYLLLRAFFYSYFVKMSFLNRVRDDQASVISSFAMLF